MIAAGLVLATALAISTEPYARSRTEVTKDYPVQHCLYWLENTDITFQQNSAGNDEIADDQEFAAIAKAFASWNAKLAPCASLTLPEGPRSSSRKVDWDGRRNDNENLVLYRTQKCDGLAPATDNCWIDEDCGNKFDCWQYTSDAVAVTTTHYSPSTGRVFDADIEFNQAFFLFTTVDGPVCPRNAENVIMCALDCVCTDIQNTATHEIGHLLGLDHTLASGSIMVPKANAGELTKRDIDPASARFVCEVYPKGEPSTDCITAPYTPKLGKADGCGCSSLAAPGFVAAWGLYALTRRRKRSP
jgi:hypothetical protein